MEPNIKKSAFGSIGLTDEQARNEADAQAARFGTINAQTLEDTTAFNLTPAKPATETAGLLGTIEANATASADGFTQALSAQRQDAQMGKNQSLDAYLKTLLSSEGETEATADKYAESVDPIEAELKDINQQIFAEQHSLRRQLESIQEAGGGTAQGQAIEMDRVRSASLRKQADLSVIQMGIQGRFDSAKAIADRAVAAQMERQRTVLDALKFNYEENRDLFNKTEQREFEVTLADRNRALDAQEAELKQISDLSLNALQNGAPTALASQMRQAKTVEEAIQIGGQYVDLLNREMNNAQIANIRSQIDDRERVDVPTAQDMLREQKRTDSQVAKTEVVINKVNEALGQVGRKTSGIIGGLTKFVPGSSAYNLARDIDTIKANIGFDTLQAMREASPTGGALGQVAVQELTMLQSTIASLDVGQSSNELKRSLNDVKVHYTNWLNTVGYTVAPDGTVVQITD